MPMRTCLEEKHIDDPKREEEEPGALGYLQLYAKVKSNCELNYS